MNCFFACRYCNLARGIKPVISEFYGEGRLLLHPCRHAWADLFKLETDEFWVRGINEDALYTLSAYALNEPRKVALRRARRETLQEAIAMVTQFPSLENALLEKAAELADHTLVELAWSLRSSLKPAWRDLERFVPIPADADEDCPCGHRDHHALPDVLKQQLLHLNLPEPKYDV